MFLILFIVPFLAWLLGFFAFHVAGRVDSPAAHSGRGLLDRSFRQGLRSAGLGKAIRCACEFFGERFLAARW